MVAELCAEAPERVISLYGLERWGAENRALLGPLLDKFNGVSAAELKKISSLQTPNSVLAIAAMPDESPDLQLPSRDLCLYLDGIQDPGNLGAILRIADWFGIPALYCAPDTVDAYSPKVVQACMGSIFRLRCTEIELPALIAENPGIPVLGAVLGGENVYAVDKQNRGLLVIGNEGRGIRPDVLPLLSRHVSIPRHPKGGAESLNAAVATGVLCALLRG